MRVEEWGAKPGSVVADMASRGELAGLQGFRVLKVLHHKNATKVSHVKHLETGRAYAIKQYDKSVLTEAKLRRALDEVAVHSELSHPNILPLHGWWSDARYLYMLLEYAQKGDLYKILLSGDHNFPHGSGFKTPPHVVALILDQVANALQYMHRKNIIHRDIKPENVVLTRAYELWVADFGLCLDASARRATSRVGTLDYLAPELISASAAHDYDAKVDVWALGVLAFELLTGRPPFSADSDVDTIRSIGRDDVFFPHYFKSDRIESFVRATLQKNPADRPALSAIREHPWLSAAKRKYSYQVDAVAYFKRCMSSSK